MYDTSRNTSKNYVIDSFAPPPPKLSSGSAPRLCATRFTDLVFVHSFQVVLQEMEFVFGYRRMFARRVVHQQIPEHVPYQRQDAADVEHQWPIVVGDLQQVTGRTLSDDRPDHVSCQKNHNNIAIVWKQQQVLIHASAVGTLALGPQIIGDPQVAKNAKCIFLSNQVHIDFFVKCYTIRCSELSGGYLFFAKLSVIKEYELFFIIAHPIAVQ